jgi:prepilin-type N-terminal cleavage/methylation domain-containing protein
MQRPLQNTGEQGRRPAMTLVEVMVSVAVTSVLAGIAISLLVGLRDWDRNMRRHSLHNEQMLRLAEQLRADIRQAVEVTLPSTEAIAIRSANEKLTRYELSPEGCRRVVTTPGQPASSTDVFAVGRTTSWGLAPGAPGRRSLFAVTLHRGIPNNNTQTPVLVVHAAAGADTAPVDE